MKARISPTSTMKFIGASALVGALFASLTGCAPSESNTSDPSASSEKAAAPAEASVYEFKTPSFGAKKALTIQIPQDLIDVAPETKELLVNSTTATALPLTSAKYCAVDFAVTYSGKGLDEVTKPLVTETDRQSAENMSIDAVRANGADTNEELQAKFDKEYQAKLDAPTWSNAAEWLAGNPEEAANTDDLDQSDPNPGLYMSSDSKNIVFVQKCADSPMDDSSMSEFKFPRPIESKPGTFASVDFNVMKDGTLTIRESTVEEYKLDSNGSWLAE